MAIWNPWHGCKKISPGCYNCYVYRRDAEFGKDSSIVKKTAAFDLPLKRNRKKEYKLQPEEEPVYTCMTSDFFIEQADAWRQEAWAMIKERPDLHFVIITKRIHRFARCIPADWGDGYGNVTICCTCENQSRADYRLPIFLKQKICHKQIVLEPMLEEIHLEKYLKSGEIEQVICGGESGDSARVCDFAWILKMMEQCAAADVNFYFKQTGSLFKKGEKIYHIDRKDQMEQAQKAGVDFKTKHMLPCGKEAESEPLEYSDLFARLSRSKFRSRFHLKEKDKAYVQEKGMDTIRSHARDFVEKRLAPAEIPNDGKQTPMRGHPVFIAQHATACCCRGCLAKWHGIPAGRALTEEQKKYVVDVLMEWIGREL